jgi:transcriptional regulator with XRE-family HTH domain
MTVNSSDVNLHITIGMVVKSWREWRGYSVTQLAELCGRPITKGYISGLERDKIRQPGDDHLILLSRALEIPVLYLVTRRLPEEESEISFGAPTISDWTDKDSDIDKNDSKAITIMLSGALEEINEISQRVEALRQVIEDLLQRKAEE